MNHTDLVLREACYLASIGVKLGTRVEFPMSVARPDAYKASMLVRIGEVPISVNVNNYKGTFIAQYFFESMFFTEPAKRALARITELLKADGRVPGTDLQPLAPHSLDMYLRARVEAR
jgi:hypothetical protein